MSNHMKAALAAEKRRIKGQTAEGFCLGYVAALEDIECERSKKPADPVEPLGTGPLAKEAAQFAREALAASKEKEAGSEKSGESLENNPPTGGSLPSSGETLPTGGETLPAEEKLPSSPSAPENGPLVSHAGASSPTGSKTSDSKPGKKPHGGAAPATK